MNKEKESIQCLACNSVANYKDYRSHNGTIDGYPVCYRHYYFDDRNFWKAVKQKEKRKCATS